MSIESLWAPWRLDYVKADKPNDECVFCVAATRDPALDKKHGVIAYGDTQLRAAQSLPLL